MLHPREQCTVLTAGKGCPDGIVKRTYKKVLREDDSRMFKKEEMASQMTVQPTAPAPRQSPQVI